MIFMFSNGSEWFMLYKIMIYRLESHITFAEVFSCMHLTKSNKSSNLLTKVFYNLGNQIGILTNVHVNILA